MQLDEDEINYIKSINRTADEPNEIIKSYLLDLYHKEYGHSSSRGVILGSAVPSLTEAAWHNHLAMGHRPAEMMTRHMLQSVPDGLMPAHIGMRAELFYPKNCEAIQKRIEAGNWVKESLELPFVSCEASMSKLMNTVDLILNGNAIVTEVNKEDGLAKVRTNMKEKPKPGVILNIEVGDEEYQKGLISAIIEDAINSGIYTLDVVILGKTDKIEVGQNVHIGKKLLETPYMNEQYDEGQIFTRTKRFYTHNNFMSNYLRNNNYVGWMNDDYYNDIIKIDKSLSIFVIKQKVAKILNEKKINFTPKILNDYVQEAKKYGKILLKRG